MRVNYVEICGFRGFRDRVRIDCGRGFTVVSGRNGVGKSTLCDAVEFALTGAIDKYRVEKAARESINDYLWWRGKGKASDHFVRVSFETPDGDEFVVTRARESGADKSASQIEDILCSALRPDNAVKQLCRTSIIRDEWIAALSVDMSETDRFELVRSALGPVEGADYADKAKEVLAASTATQSRVNASYHMLREQLHTALSQLSEAKDAVAQAGDVATALAIVQREASPDVTEIAGVVSLGRRALVDRRARLGQSGDVVVRGRDVAILRRQFDDPASVAERKVAEARLSAAAVANNNAQEALAIAQRTFEVEEKADAIAASLAALIEHGERLGLHDNHCPLCAAERTDDEFASGLELARDRMKGLATGVAEARRNLAVASEAAQITSRELHQADQAWTEITESESTLRALEQAHMELIERLGIDGRFATDPDGLDRELAKERNLLIELERALITLEASQAVSQISALENRVTALRGDVDTAASDLAQAEAATGMAKSIEQEIRRVSGEIIDERLAQISPLLNELYQRLRPHPDWRTIQYSIRGDLRRFLTLRVGDGLNPQFVFSSGQRRAAGMAFLLSVHLARAWVKLRTIILDDPVQHIDDFRALHLAEVLAAFRADGRQVICAVEDSALAELLCRRLLSTPEETGRRYELDIDASGATAVAGEWDIPPMPAAVLRSGDTIPAAG